VCTPRQHTLAFIRHLLAARRVVSASLHGVILAEAYGIPAVLLQAGGTETRFKYDDYYAGTGRTDYRVARSVDEALALGAGAPLPDVAPIATRLLRAFPYDLWDAPPAAMEAEPADIAGSTARA
jgi:pyruvyltransferase